MVTAGSTLDLSHTTVSGFTVASTNALGTTFTVGDLGTAFQIAGGLGQDTIVATGFNFSADQRQNIRPRAARQAVTEFSVAAVAYTVSSDAPPTTVSAPRQLQPRPARDLHRV